MVLELEFEKKMEKDGGKEKWVEKWKGGGGGGRIKRTAEPKNTQRIHLKFEPQSQFKSRFQGTVRCFTPMC